jgi:anti-sigma B factor antagonist
LPLNDADLLKTQHEARRLPCICGQRDRLPMGFTMNLLIDEDLTPRKTSSYGITLVHSTGQRTSLDEETIDRIRDQLFALADEGGESDLTLDFSNVEYLSSSALGVLLRLRKKLLTKGLAMSIENLRPHVHEVFVVTRLDRLFNVRLPEQVSQLAARGRSFRQRKDRWIETPEERRDETCVIAFLQSSVVEVELGSL